MIKLRHSTLPGSGRPRPELDVAGRGMVTRVPPTTRPELGRCGAPDPGSPSSSSVDSYTTRGVPDRGSSGRGLDLHLGVGYT